MVVVDVRSTGKGEASASTITSVVYDKITAKEMSSESLFVIYEDLFKECLSTLSADEVVFFADYIRRTFKKAHFSLYQLLSNEKSPRSFQQDDVVAENLHAINPPLNSVEHYEPRKRRLVSRCVQTIQRQAGVPRYKFALAPNKL